MENENHLDKNELLSRLDRLLDWIKSCDTKTSIVIAGIGLFLTLFTSEHSFNMLKEILTGTLHNLNFSNILYLLFLMLSAGLFIFGTYCLIRVLTPRLANDIEVSEGMYNDSLYFFESISKNNYLEFSEKIKSRTQSDDINDILSQIFINARICTVKYDYYKKGIRFGSIGIAALLTLFIIGVILNKAGGFS